LQLTFLILITDKIKKS